MTTLHNEKKPHNENLVDLGGTYSKLNHFFDKNKKIVYGVAIAIVVAVAGYLYYEHGVKAPREREAASLMYKAEFYFGLDSFNLALNGRAEGMGGLPGFMGFQAVADEYGNTKSGNLAKYYAGICNLRLGKFQEAIDMLGEFKSNDVLVGAMALGCMGDAYRELGQSEEAAKHYEKAANKNNNSFTAPMYLKKAGMTYEEDLQNYDKALEMYKKIRSEYGNTMEGRDIGKYIARLETMSGK